MKYERTREVRIQRGYVPGSIGRIAELHGTYYHENWGFGVFFEAKVASELAEFMGRYNDEQDGFWMGYPSRGTHLRGGVQHRF